MKTKRCTRGWGALLAAALVASAPASHGFQMLPYSHRYKDTRVGEEFLAHISHPVHEEITEAALELVRAQGAQESIVPGHCLAQRNAFDPGLARLWSPLMRGVWWNDDPNQDLYYGSAGAWLFALKNGRAISATGKDLGGMRREINSSFRMVYRSHYLDLQFLHAMASADQEAPAATQQNILLWAEFSYGLATCAVDPERALPEAVPQGLRALFAQQSGWTVSYLLNPRTRLREPGYGWMGLGTLLHLVQDSYSASHVQRDPASTQACRKGRIVRFHSYLHQDSGKHGRQDVRLAAFPEGVAHEDIPAIRESAALIAMAARGDDWVTVVRPYLEQEVFCLDADAQPSDAGPFAAD